MSIHTILSQMNIEFNNLRKDCAYSAPEVIKDRYKSFFSDFATQIVEEVGKEIDGMSERHRCVNCHTIYAEYVNGCPKCWDKYEKPFKVIPFPINIPDIRTKLQKMKGDK